MGAGLQKRPEQLSGRWMNLPGSNLFLFVRKTPTSLHRIGEGIIIVSINSQLAEHWSQGYHRGEGASRKWRKFGLLNHQP
jgi:hypothetical protein